MEPQSRHGIIRAALLLIMLGTALRAVAAATDQPPTPTLTNWRAACTRFQKAGALIAAKEYKRAQAELT